MWSNKKVMTRTVLAVGADIKNRFLVAKKDRTSFGPDIGDLGNAGNFEIFEKEVKKAVKKSKPVIVAHDLHPGYFSTRFAASHKAQARLLGVQHHHAHIASVIQEYSLKKPVIGVSFDGTGLGTDGNIWGGEFLLVDRRGFKRLAHLEYLKMPGGDKVINEPWRMVISILGEKAIPILGDIKKEDKNIILSMMAKNINSPLTSSAGRIFDACAALLGIARFASHEAEGPIKLEGMCKDDIEAAYRFDITKSDGQYIIDTKPIFLDIHKDLKKNKDKAVIATKFHNSMVDIIVKTVKRLSKDAGCKDVALSGGVFQNRFLKEKVKKRLLSSKFNCFINNKTPVNDYNISLGQYYVSCGTR